MAEKQKYQTPSGMAGLVKYYDEEDVKFKMDPKIVIGVCVALVIIEVILFLFLPRFLV